MVRVPPVPSPLRVALLSFWRVCVPSMSAPRLSGAAGGALGPDGASGAEGYGTGQERLGPEVRQAAWSIWWRTFWRRFKEAEAAVEFIDVRIDRMMAAVRAVDERATVA